MTLATRSLIKNLSSALGAQAEREQLIALISIATQTVAPLWPLDSAIAVNHCRASRNSRSRKCCPRPQPCSAQGPRSR